MKKLVLLGAWNNLPLIAWPWHADNAVKHFYKLTKIKVRNFTYVKDNLHYQVRPFFSPNSLIIGQYL